MRLVYRRRRAELAGRLALPLEGVAAGLHALLPVDSAERERALIARGRRAGVDLHGHSGRVFGYMLEGEMIFELVFVDDEELKQRRDQRVGKVS
jgi:GntR family transcriptional regulator/MocR family aminotransferase